MINVPTSLWFQTQWQSESGHKNNACHKETSLIYIVSKRCPHTTSQPERAHINRFTQKVYIYLCHHNVYTHRTSQCDPIHSVLYSTQNIYNSPTHLIIAVWKWEWCELPIILSFWRSSGWAAMRFFIFRLYSISIFWGCRCKWHLKTQGKHPRCSVLAMPL